MEIPHELFYFYTFFCIEVRARNSYEEALNICERDKKWLKESMDRFKESIRNKIEKLNSMME